MISEIETGYFHGSCVDFNGKSILAIGASGSGKSSLALGLIALGGDLISDDQVILTDDDKGVIVTSPSSIRGKIEAYSVGVLNCPNRENGYLQLVIDLSVEPKKRFPEPATVQIGSHDIEVIAGKGVSNLPMAAKLLTLYGRHQDIEPMQK